MTAAIQVIQYMNTGLSVSKACKEVGLPRSSYYAIIDREKIAIAAFQEMVDTNRIANLWEIVLNQNAILQQIIREGLAETTCTKVRLAIYKTLTDIQNKLVDELRFHNEGIDQSSLDFTGPILRTVKSRYCQTGLDTSSKNTVMDPQIQTNT